MMMKGRYYYIAVFAIAGLAVMGGCGKAGSEAEWETVSMVENIPEEKERKADEGEAGEDGRKEEGAEGGADMEDSIVWDEIKGEGIKTVEGDVESIGEGDFVIARIYTGSLKDGGDIMVAGADGAEDKELITVRYNDEVKVSVRTSTDGMTSTEREGSVEELEKGSNVTLTGSWEGEIFRADEISIFVLDKKNEN